MLSLSFVRKNVNKRDINHKTFHKCLVFSATAQYNRLQVNFKMQIRLIGESTEGQNDSSTELLFWPFFVF